MSVRMLGKSVERPALGVCFIYLKVCLYVRVCVCMCVCIHLWSSPIALVYSYDEFCIVCLNKEWLNLQTALKYENSEMAYAARGCVVNATCLSDGEEQCHGDVANQVAFSELCSLMMVSYGL